MSDLPTPSSKMTIIQVLPSLLSGGVETGTIDIAKALVDQGHRALVVSSGGPMVQQLESVGAQHIQLPVHSKNPYLIWKNALRLKEIVRDNKVDLIHARSRAPAWSCYWATKGTDIPFMTTFHGTYGHHSKLKRWYNAVMLRSDQTIAVSNFIAKHIQTIYPNRQQAIQVIHRGIDTDKFNPQSVSSDEMNGLKQLWGIDEDKLLLMLPGRITRWKGHSVLIEALSKIDSSQLICLMVGDDQGKTQYRQELDKLIKQHHFEKQIKFVGACQNMPTAYTLADIVISASTDPEAFGRVACEAQAMNCLVIATAHGGSQETIADCQRDLLCLPSDANSLAKSLAKAIKQIQENNEAVFSKSRAHIAQHFSLKKMCQDTLTLYAKQLDCKRDGK